MTAKGGTAITATGTAAGYEHLGQFQVFSGLSAPVLAVLSAHAQKRSWPAGQTIFQRGDSGDYMLAITQGRIKVTLNSAQGRELMLRQAGPGDVLGELALIDGQPRSADCVAVEATSALVLRRENFLQAAKAHPDIALAMASYMSQLLRGTNFQMESIALHDLQGRLIRFMLYTLRQIYGDTPPPRPHLQLNLSQTDLSSILGSSRPKINQALQNLIAANALTRQGEGFDCNLAQLRAMVDLTDDEMPF